MFRRQHDSGLCKKKSQRGKSPFQGRQFFARPERKTEGCHALQCLHQGFLDSPDENTDARRFFLHSSQEIVTSYRLTKISSLILLLTLHLGCTKPDGKSIDREKLVHRHI